MLDRPFSVAIVLLLAFLLGCGNDHEAEEFSAAMLAAQHPSGPTNLIQRITRTDHILVVYRDAEDHQYSGCTLKIKGEEMKKILLAIASLRGSATDGDSGAVCEWQLQFYKGSSLLEKANFEGKVIRYNKDYCDNSGVLSNLYEEIWDRFNPHRHDVEKEIIVGPPRAK